MNINNILRESISHAKNVGNKDTNYFNSRGNRWKTSCKFRKSLHGHMLTLIIIKILVHRSLKVFFG